jgi:hypothetical protein
VGNQAHRKAANKEIDKLSEGHAEIDFRIAKYRIGDEVITVIGV